MKTFSSALFGSLLALAALTMASRHAAAVPTTERSSIVSCPECGPVPLCPPSKPNCQIVPPQ